MTFAMPSLVVFLALLTSAHALTCVSDGGEPSKKWASDCSTKDFVAACYVPVTTDGGTNSGCIPKQYANFVSVSESGCISKDNTAAGITACWCITDNCNTKEWAAATAKAWKPPPICWTGIAGANNGPTCANSALYTKMKQEKSPEINCDSKALSAVCVENNKDMGKGDGCNTFQDAVDKTKWTHVKDKATCEAITKNGGGETAKPRTNGINGTTRHCHWVPEKANATVKSECEANGMCILKTPECGLPCDRTPRCERSDAYKANETAWMKQLGSECEKRLKSGCFSNNDWLGDSDECKVHKTGDACLAKVSGCDDPNAGTCSGTVTLESAKSRNCSARKGEKDCTNYTVPPSHTNPSGVNKTGCTWKGQCCQWLAKSADPVDTCGPQKVQPGHAKLRKGTMDGLCAYSDGQGPPNAEIVKAGFEHSLFTAGPDKFTTACSIIASFRIGKGSATAIGADKADLIADRCSKSGSAYQRWKGLSEHIGHTSATIDEYCTNFVPEASVMAALKANSPGFVVKAVEQGQFDAILPGMKGELYIVTAKPEFGKCLFTAQQGKWGAGICTCDKKECNGKAALNLVVDREKGPMRLLQFIDGSLATEAAAINGIVAGLMDDKGKFVKAKAGVITEANVDAMIKIAAVAAKTNKVELWGLIQDYQKLLTAEAAYKKTLSEHTVFSDVTIDKSKVAATNTAAGTMLYMEDGTPMTVSLAALPAGKKAAVATASGLSEAQLDLAKTQADNMNKGKAVVSGTPTKAAVPAVVTSTGNVEVKMTKAHAEALTKTPAKAKLALASAIAKTIGVAASDVTVTAIYIDGVKVKDSARRLADSVVKVEWTAKAKTAVVAANINAETLKTNIQTEAKAVANVEIKVTETPTMTAQVQAPGPSATSSAWSSRCFASALLVGGGFFGMMA